MGSGELWCLIDFNYNAKFGSVWFYGLFIKWNKADGKRKFSHEQICSYSPDCTSCFLLPLCACRPLTLLPESTEALPSPATRNHLPRWSLSVSEALAWFLSPIGPWPASSNRLYWLDNLKSGSPWKPQKLARCFCGFCSVSLSLAVLIILPRLCFTPKTRNFDCLSRQNFFFFNLQALFKKK